MTLTAYIRDHPYHSSVWFLVLVLLNVTLFGAIQSVFQLENLVQIGLAELALFLFGIFLLTHLGWLGDTGFLTGIRFSQIPLFILPGAFALLALTEGIGVTAPATLAWFAILAILIGCAEETIFRGLILTTLLLKGTIRAVIISSVLFTLPHLLNAFRGVWDLTFTLVDIGAAFGIGITFAALCLRTDSIWPAIGLHALFDFTALVSLGGIEIPAQSMTVLLTSVVAGVVYVFYGLFLIRHEIKSGANKPSQQG